MAPLETARRCSGRSSSGSSRRRTAAPPASSSNKEYDNVSEEQNDVIDAVSDDEAVEAVDVDAEAAPEGGRSKKEAALENEGEIAADYLEERLDIADLAGDIDTYTEGGRAHV